MITEAGWIVIVTIVCGCVTTVVGMLTRMDVKSLRPEVVDVREQLKEANKFIIDQGHKIQGLRDEIANRIPVFTEKQFNEEYTSMPPYRKADKKPPT